MAGCRRRTGRLSDTKTGSGSSFFPRPSEKMQKEASIVAQPPWRQQERRGRALGGESNLGSRHSVPASLPLGGYRAASMSSMSLLCCRSTAKACPLPRHRNATKRTGSCAATTRTACRKSRNTGHQWNVADRNAHAIPPSGSMPASLPGHALAVGWSVGALSNGADQN